MPEFIIPAGNIPPGVSTVGPFELHDRTARFVIDMTNIVAPIRLRILGQRDDRDQAIRVLAESDFAGPYLDKGVLITQARLEAAVPEPPPGVRQRIAGQVMSTGVALAAFAGGKLSVD